MSFTVPLAMFGWIPLVLVLFRVLPPRRAVMAAFFAAWMFLPNYTYSFPGMPDYDKTTAASIGILLGSLLFAREPWKDLTFDARDALIVLWCLTPTFASLTNGLGLYDGLAAAKNYFVAWSIPYLIGRAYFRTAQDFRELAAGVFIGGLIYVPFCWIEMILSPQLHNWVYGWHPHDFIQSIRGGSYRPVIFMKHGLMVGMWMGAATLCGWFLYQSGELKKWKRRIGLSPNLLLILLVVTFLACRSMGAILLVGFAVALLWASIRLRRPLLVGAFALLPLLYIGLRTIGGWDAQNLVDAAYRLGDERGASLEYRILNETMLIEKAAERSVFGWGGWGRSRIYNDEGEDISVTDGYWIILYGTTGLVGVAAFYSLLLAPLFSALRLTGRADGNPLLHPMLPLALLLAIYAVDALFNDMKNPVYMLIAGGLISLVSRPAPFPTDEKPLFPTSAPTLPQVRYL